MFRGGRGGGDRRGFLARGRDVAVSLTGSSCEGYEDQENYVPSNEVKVTTKK